MTCIAAVETPRGVWIAWDSCISDDSAARDQWSGKVWTAGGPMAIGAAGDCAAMQRLSWSVQPVPPAAGELERWAADTIPAWLAEHDATGTPLLIAVRACVLVVDEHGFCWRSAHGYAAIGSGAAYALGALAASGSHGRERAEAAVAAACRHHVGCAPPVLSTWVDTMGAPWTDTHH